MTREHAATAAKRGIQWWADRCKRSAPAALATAVAAGFLAGMALRIFERKR